MMKHRLRTCLQAGFVFLAGLAGTSRAADYAITTFAGSANVAGSADATGSAASFNNPYGVAIDAAKNLYVADTVNNIIRKITPERVVTTLAGTPGQFGSTDGTGSAARFNFPVDVAVDSAGNVYVTDATNSTIRKITPAGAVTTLAGSAFQFGATDGPGAAARFFRPYGIAVDGAGNIFVSEGGNHLIRRITPDGVVSTFAGAAGISGFVNGTGSAARFNEPWGLALDGSGNLYVADSGNNAIRRITPAGVVTTMAGLAGPAGAQDGPAAVARFNRPRGVAVDSGGNVYVADYGNAVLRQVSSGGTVSTLAGSAGIVGSTDSVGTSARFYDLTDVVTDGTTVFVADTSNNSIRRGVPASSAGLPGISVHPLDQVVSVGQAVSFRVTATGSGLGYQWLKNGGLIAGATGATYTINSAQPGDVGVYSVRVSSAGGSVDSGPGTLSVEPVAAGAINITARPLSQNVETGQSATFSITATGSGLTYRWLKNGTPIAGATSPSYTIPSAQAGDVATYTVEVTSAGTTRSASARLAVGTAVPLAITSQPAAANVAEGQNAVFTVEAVGSNLSYQWSKNGTAISGATTNTLTLVAVKPADAGSYTVRVTSSTGAVTSVPATLTVGPPNTGGGNDGGNNGGGGPARITSRLVNLSILTDIAAAGDAFTMGYVVGGAGTTGSKPILIRAAGPTLGGAPFNVPGALADPKLELFAGQNKTTENDNWGGSATLSTAFASVGAFAYGNATSLDAASLANIGLGDNSVRVSGGTGTGTVIAELYDSTPFTSMTTTTPRLVNVSVLKHLGTGLTAGFVIDGTGPKRVLIRAVGPTIGAAPFNVPGAVADPQLTLFSGQTSIATNNNWGGTAELTAAFGQVGAFALPAGSLDAALLATLAPGSYTVQASGVNNTTGVAIVEVYELP
jgi:sugar lactone lactonase YvrE